MKIAIINSLYAPYQVGGAERSVEMLAQGLVAEGMEVSVLSLHEGQDVVREMRDGVTVWRLPLRNAYWPFDLAKRSPVQRLTWHLRDMYNAAAAADLRRALLEIAPDVVHTNNLAGFSVSAWATIAALRLPIVHTARDYYLLHPNSTLFVDGATQDEAGLVPRLWSMVKKRAGRRVSAFVAISNYVKDIHLRNGHFARSTSFVVHNSVSLPSAPTVKVSGMGTPRVFGFIGRLDPSKGVELLLDAARRAPDTQWRIAGGGRPEYVAALKQSAPANVVFLGHQDPAVFFAQVHVLVVPSMWAEPLGRVVLEAYAHGVPVLASGLGGLADVVDAGRTGWYFDVRDVDSLLDAMHRAQDADIATLSAACLVRAQDFGMSAIAGQYLSIYRAALPGRQANVGQAAPPEVSR